MDTPTDPWPADREHLLIPGSTWRHFKGGVYRVLAVGKSPEDLSDQVVYQDENMVTWAARSKDDFLSAASKGDGPRFTYIGEQPSWQRYQMVLQLWALDGVILESIPLQHPLTLTGSVHLEDGHHVLTHDADHVALDHEDGMGLGYALLDLADFDRPLNCSLVLKVDSDIAHVSDADTVFRTDDDGRHIRVSAEHQFLEQLMRRALVVRDHRFAGLRPQYSSMTQYLGFGSDAGNVAGLAALSAIVIGYHDRVRGGLSQEQAMRWVEQAYESRRALIARRFEEVDDSEVYEEIWAEIQARISL